MKPVFAAILALLLSLTAIVARAAEPISETSAVWLAEHYTKIRIPDPDARRYPSFHAPTCSTPSAVVTE
jgi:hypothetical protein